MIEIRTAIAGLYLWLLFGFLSTIVSCDIKRLMTHNVFFRHTVGIISFFLLFTVIEPDNEMDVFSIWTKTIYIYLIFLFMTKSKWYFSIPVLLLLLVDQSLKFQINFEKQKEVKEVKEVKEMGERGEMGEMGELGERGEMGENGKNVENVEKDSTIVKYENIRNKLNVSIIALIVVGFLHYTYRQYNEFGPKFSLVKLILYHSCRSDKINDK